jgi:hypothetical protein
MTLRTDSERRLAAALPALLTLLLGWSLFLGSVSKEERLLRQRVKNLGSIRDVGTQVEQARIDLVALNGEAETLRGQLADGALTFDRNTAMRRISMFCEEHRIQIRQTAVETSSSKLPTALRQSQPGLRGEDGMPPQVWRIELAASYGAMLRLLQDLSTTSAAIVPLNLTMDSDPKERLQPVWKLYVWL